VPETGLLNDAGEGPEKFNDDGKVGTWIVSVVIVTEWGTVSFPVKDPLVSLWRDEMFVLELKPSVVIDEVIVVVEVVITSTSS
jgi:hypothetical protein